MPSMPLRLRLLLAASILFGLLALAGLGQTAVPVAHAATLSASVSSTQGTTVPRSRPDQGLMYAQVREGVYTVDGLVAKVRLNYEVVGANYLYLFVPGLGTAVVSAAPDPEVVLTGATVRNGELTFSVGGHHFDLTGITLRSENDGTPTRLYVRLDRAAWQLGRQAMVGFGNRAQMPYEWPGALPSKHAEESRAVPPVPENLLPAETTAQPDARLPAAATPGPLRPVVLR